MRFGKEKERAEKKKKLLAFFLTGFALGVFYIMILGKTENSNMLMSSYFFSKYQYMEYEAWELMKYILKSRVSVLVFLWLMGMTVLGSMTALLFSWWVGFSMGLILTMAVVRLGIAGILLCVISTLPQYLIYVPAFVFGLVRVYEAGQSRKLSVQYGIAFLVAVVLVLLGCFLESYINPVFLKSLIRKM